MATTAAMTAATAAMAAMVAKEPAAAESTTVYADPLLDPALYPCQSSKNKKKLILPVNKINNIVGSCI
jgi:hypothetical protein